MQEQFADTYFVLHPEQCRRCNGTGRVNLDRYRVSRSNGSNVELGEQLDECSRCKGSGTAFVRVPLVDAMRELGFDLTGLRYSLESLRHDVNDLQAGDRPAPAAAPRPVKLSKPVKMALQLLSDGWIWRQDGDNWLLASKSGATYSVTATAHERLLARGYIDEDGVISDTGRQTLATQ